MSFRQKNLQNWLQNEEKCIKNIEKVSKTTWELIYIRILEKVVENHRKWGKMFTELNENCPKKSLKKLFKILLK